MSGLLRLYRTSCELLILCSVFVLDFFAAAECRRATADGRVGCGDSASPDDWVKTRVDTTDRVGRLRAAMASADAVGGPPLAAYIVTGRDEHQVRPRLKIPLGTDTNKRCWCIFGGLSLL